MYSKTQGIVLSNSKYSDKYSIAHIFTRDFGRVAYLIPKTKSKSAKINPAIFFPLSILNLEVEHLPQRDIQRIKDTDRNVVLSDICTDITKITLSFFLSEFLVKVLRETDNNELLFDYLKQSIEVLEESSNGLANYHLTFMWGLTRFLGIYPNVGNYKKNSYFSLMEGEFMSTTPPHSYFLNREESFYLTHFSRINYGNMHLFRMSRNDRNIIINHMITYYRLHVTNFSTLKSLDVLRECQA